MKFFNQSKTNSGFTLIELLVVVAIIGMLVSVAITSYTNARRKSRDSKRLSDMSQIKLGMDLYFSGGSGYPDMAEWVTNHDVYCNGNLVFKVPADLLSSSSYVYTTGGVSSAGCASTNPVWTTYKLQFTTEGDTDIGPAGIYYLHPGGITATAPF